MYFDSLHAEQFFYPVGLPLNSGFLMKFSTKQVVDYTLLVFFVTFLASFLETQAFSLAY